MIAEDCSTEAMWTNFKSMLIELRGKFVPKTSTKSEWKRKGTIPIDKQLQAEIKCKQNIPQKMDECKECDRLRYSKSAIYEK